MTTGSTRATFVQRHLYPDYPFIHVLTQTTPTRLQQHRIECFDKVSDVPSIKRRLPNCAAHKKVGPISFGSQPPWLQRASVNDPISMFSCSPWKDGLLSPRMTCSKQFRLEFDVTEGHTEQCPTETSPASQTSILVVSVPPNFNFALK